MREMHEIESQRSAIPPIPASTVKDHLHDDAWAQQYIDDGKRFHVSKFIFLIRSILTCHKSNSSFINPNLYSKFSYKISIKYKIF